jgi:hypothetical protein
MVGAKMMGRRSASALALALVVGMGMLLSACGSDPAFPERDKGADAPRMVGERKDAAFGSESLFGSTKRNDDGGRGIGVNSFLWRASLDTLGFMPIANADPFGGTILTEWYQLPETPAERFKLNIFIIDRALRADGVRVTVFKQVRDASGAWVDTKVDPKMNGEIENSILTRARQLRQASE